MLYADVVGYEGLYQISADGKVKSPKGIKKTEITNNGYERVNLFKNGKCKHFSVHRLVASAFIPNPENYEMVNHIDGNKLNNCVSNLEWCDASYNTRHAYENNLIKPKETGVIQYSKEFVEIKRWKSIAEACKQLKLNHANIVTVCGQKTNRKYAGGFIWRYADGRKG